MWVHLPIFIHALSNSLAHERTYRQGSSGGCGLGRPLRVALSYTRLHGHRPICLFFLWCGHPKAYHIAWILLTYVDFSLPSPSYVVEEGTGDARSPCASKNHLNCEGMVFIGIGWTDLTWTAHAAKLGAGAQGCLVQKNLNSQIYLFK